MIVKELKDLDFKEGEVLLFNKPYEWTSFDVVRKVRNTIREKKIGHAGTLDPLATGLLILCTGKMTKKIDGFQSQQKEYIGEMILGKTTPSFDLETEVDAEFDISHITPAQVVEAALTFLGEIAQTPPIYSAIKIDGQRLYKLARNGETKDIPPRNVHIYEFDIEEVSLPVIKFKVVCSKGTYIRSLVRDLGLKLNVGAYMSALRRTKIGDFDVSTAYELDKFVQDYKEFIT
ncbi:MAG TPA: tRNA pseudouridine(55) synthase TruB [Cytophagaceae bacterium]|jgi:tRNA pseudouridine55 synthase